MSKYVIEIEEKPLCVFDKDTQTYFPRLWRVKGFNSLVFDEEGLSRLEELNSDYINEHFSDMQDTAYQKGLEDAWEAARKIIEMTSPPYWEVFNEYKEDLFGKITATEAIAKLKAYEEKQKADDEIKVGDVVMIKQFKHPENHLFVVTKVSDESVWGVEGDGSWNYWAINEVIKTDKHFDIEKILEEMRHD